jgi:DNA-binding transcriptional LysR family regulator
MRFDLTDLRLFANIVDAGSITGGAAQTHMTLASASQRVLGMEGDLGTPLLLRSQRGVQPTEAGHTLVHHARTVLQQMERLRGEPRGVRCRPPRPRSPAVQHLGDDRASVGGPRHFPGAASARVDLEEQGSADIVDAVRAGLCDLGIVSDAVDVEGLQSAVFRRDDLVLIVPRGHPLARRRKVALAEVLDARFVGLADGNPLQEHAALHARQLGKRLNYRVRVRGFDAVCRMVEQGIGVGIVPRAAADRFASSMSIRCIPVVEAWAERYLLACARDVDALPLNARRMLEHLLVDAPARG